MENTEGRITPGTSMSVFVLMSTLFLGVVLFVIGYIVSRLSNRSSDSTKKKTAVFDRDKSVIRAAAEAKRQTL
ncbi:hypothetical protein WN51_11463 [Melipona quadrifasciata]|uniref:Uncharacterized protein n=1 Tax=Melipona quadrifasciata TaxID=166423 RepID=A0A0N0U7I4_9HYME|nr:hypothetical protein WN51_11463 [Melipona quadrifasciata]